MVDLKQCRIKNLYAVVAIADTGNTEARWPVPRFNDNTFVQRPARLAKLHEIRTIVRAIVLKLIEFRSRGRCASARRDYSSEDNCDRKKSCADIIPHDRTPCVPVRLPVCVLNTAGRSGWFCQCQGTVRMCVSRWDSSGQTHFARLE